MMLLYGMTTFQDVDEDDATCEVCGERWRKLFFVVLFSISGTGFAMGDLCPECIQAAQQIFKYWIDRLLPLV
jgi:hypothetical protein